MPLTDDHSVQPGAVLYRVLVDPNWITTKDQTRRPSKQAFYEARGEVSYFEEGPDVLAEVQRLFPGLPIASVPASVIREEGLVIERRPHEAQDLPTIGGAHVIAGPQNPIARSEFEKKARRIAKHPNVSIIDPELSPPAEAPRNGPNA